MIIIDRSLGVQNAYRLVQHQPGVHDIVHSTGVVYDNVIVYIREWMQHRTWWMLPLRCILIFMVIFTIKFSYMVAPPCT